MHLAVEAFTQKPGRRAWPRQGISGRSGNLIESGLYLGTLISKAICSKKRKLEDFDYEEKRDGLNTMQAKLLI